jgi:hypothetical protein
MKLLTRRLRTETLEDRTTPATAFGLDATGLNLLRFDTTALGTIAATIPITGLAVGGATESIAAVDFRPANGKLYALGVNETAVGNDEGRLYTIDVTTGAATQVGTGALTTPLLDTATTYGLDFDPVADLVRIVNDTDQNLRVNPTDASVVADTALSYAAGDVSTGSPDVAAVAYANNFSGATSTTLYGIDYTRDRLVTVNPTAGTLTSSASKLGIDVTSEVGFEITASGTALASVTVAGETNSKLVQIDLATGTATSLGAIGDAKTGTLRGIALAPAGTLAFAGPTFTGTEGGKATITVNRIGGTEGTASVQVAVTGGTATAGDDFTGLPATLTFGPGITSQSITVTLPEDTIAEATETVLLALQTPGGGAAVGGQTTATLTITDNEPPDTTSPTVTVEQAAGQADPTNLSPILFTVTFSEPVVGFDSGDVTLGGTAGAKTAVVSGTGPTYTVSVSGMSSAGTVIVSIPEGAAADPTGNPSEASTSIDNTVIFMAGDTTPPTVTINQAASQADPTNAAPVLFTVVFSEAVTGFDASDVVLEGGGATGATATVTGSGTTYTVAVTGFTRAGPVRASVPAGAAIDAAGNANLASTSTDNQVTFNFGKGIGLGGTIAKETAVGPDAGGGNLVRVYNPDASERMSLTVFPGTTGGIRTAAADFTGDGIADIVVGTGPGSASQVLVLDGVTKAQLFAIQPFEATFVGGVFVSAGDVTGDGIPDLVISPDRTGGPRVRVFDGANKFAQVIDFFGIEDVNFRGGARTAVGDVSGDGVGDLIVAAGFSGGPRVAVLDGS